MKDDVATWTTARHLNCTKTPVSFQSATEKITSGVCSQLLRGLEIRKGKSLLQHYPSLLYTSPARCILFEDISPSCTWPVYEVCSFFLSYVYFVCTDCQQFGAKNYIIPQKTRNLAHLMINTDQPLAVQTSCISHLTVIQLQLQVWVQSKKLFFPANMNLNPPYVKLKQLPFVKDPIKNILDWGFLGKINRTAVWVKVSAITHKCSFVLLPQHRNWQCIKN